MSLLKDIFAAETSISDLRNPELWLTNHLGGSVTRSGQQVNPGSAMGLMAYWACVHNIAEDIGKLPLPVFRRLSDGGKEPVSDHAVNRLLNTSPNADMTAITVRETLTHWAVGWGNGYAEIVRDGRGKPTALYPIHPSRVAIKRDADGDIVYDVHVDDRRTNRFEVVRFPQENIFHLHGLGEGLTGYSPLRFAAESIGVGLAAQTFGATFFGNGTTLGGILKIPETIDEDARKQLRREWMEMHQGADRAHLPAVLQGGIEWEGVGIPPKEAQFLETRQFAIEEMARLFRMPPHKLQHLLRSTFSNIHSQNTEYVVDTLTPWAERWEQEGARKLFDGGRERDLYLKHNFNALLRGDPAGRGTLYRTMFQMGAMTPNEVRRLEDMNPMGPEGDRHYIQMNMTTLDAVVDGKNLKGKGAAGSPGAVAEFVQADVDVETFRASLAAQRPVFVDAADRVLRKEAMAVARAEKRHADDPEKYGAWAEKFYVEQAAYLIAAFEPAFAAAAACAELSDLAVSDCDLSRALEVHAQGYAERGRNGGTTEPEALAAAVMELAERTILDGQIVKTGAYDEG